MGSGQIDVKFRTKHVIYQKLATFMLKKDNYINRFGGAIFVM